MYSPAANWKKKTWIIRAEAGLQKILGGRLKGIQNAHGAKKDKPGPDKDPFTKQTAQKPNPREQGPAARTP